MISWLKKLFVVSLLVGILFLLPIKPNKVLAANQNDYLVKLANPDIQIQNINLEDTGIPAELKSKELHLWKKANNLTDTQVQELKMNPDVLEVQKVISYSVLTSPPDDPKYNAQDPVFSGDFDQWDLRKIGLLPAQGSMVDPSGWDISVGSANTIVAVIDTGIDLTHPDLQNNIWTNTAELNGTPGVDDDGNGYIDDVHGWNFYGTCVSNSCTPDNDVQDQIGHGTHVSGTIAAVTNNTTGVAGICWNCKIMPLRVFGTLNSTNDILISEAMNYAVDNGAKIINLSLSGQGYSQIMQDAVDYAWSHGVLVVAAAGNDTADTSLYSPAGLSDVIAVGATDSSDAIASFSNIGAKVDIVAPGVFVLSTKLRSLSTTGCINDPDYYCLNGTSMSSPHVSGSAALLYDLHRTDLTPWNNIKLRAALLKNADDKGAPGFDDTFGFGRLNILAPLQLSSLTLPPSIPTVTLNTPVSPYFAHTITLTGSVNSNDVYTYTLQFDSFGSTIYKYTGRGNVSSANLVNQDLGLTEGTYNVTLIAEDFNGSVNNTSPISMQVDLTAPADFTPATTLHDTSATFIFSTTDSGSGLSHYEASLDNAAFATVTSPYTTPTLAFGTHNIKIKAFDNVGNSKVESVDFDISSTVARAHYLRSFGDFSGDGIVDLSDLSILASNWLGTNTNADANQDGIVDLSDFSILATNWLQSF